MVQESPLCPESTIESANRRNFIKKAAVATTALAAGETLLRNSGLAFPESSASSRANVCGTDVIASCCVVVNNGNSNDGCLPPGLRFGSASGEGIASVRAPCSVIRYGLCFYTDYEPRMYISQCGIVNVLGCFFAVNCVTVGTALGVGTCAVSSYPLQVAGNSPKIGQFRSHALSGDRSAQITIQNSDSSVVDWNVGVSGKCNAAKLPDGSFYIQRCGLSNIPISINKCGYVGINNDNPTRRLCITGRIQASCGVGVGTQTINTTLAVNGSIAAKTVSPSCTTYDMKTADFAVLESVAGSTVVLPAAKTQNGMMAFIKNVSSGTVSVKPSGSDTIEGNGSSSPFSLTRKYDSLLLISNGSNEWFLVGNSVGGAFKS